MHQIKSSIKQNSIFIFVLLFLFCFSCKQNSQTKLEPNLIITTKNKFDEDFKTVKDFDDLVRHLNQYDSLWRRVIGTNKDFNFVKDMASEFARIQNKGNLGKVPEDLISETLRGIPKEGGLREAFLDIWIESQGKSINKN